MWGKEEIIWGENEFGLRSLDRGHPRGDIQNII
jgi:hypothetical protein